MSDQVTATVPRPSAGPRWLVALLAVFVVLAASAVVVPLAIAAGEKPANVAVSAQGMDTVQVTWSAVAGSSTYIVQASTSSSFSKPKAVQVSSTEAWVQDLTRNQKYYFRVATWDTASKTAGTWSDTKSATPKYLYSAPTSIAPTNVGGTFVDLAWPYVLGAPAYRLRATPTKGGASITTDSDNSDGNGRVTGLKKNTRYKITVAVLLAKTATTPAVRMSAYSSASVTVTTSNYPVDAPLDVMLSSSTADSFKLSWTAPANLVAGYKYQVQYALNRTMTKSAKKSTPTTSTSQTITGLTDNTNYFVRVRVVDPNGTQKSDYSDSMQVKTPTKYGFISGTVSGPSSNDVVANAYTSGGTMVATAAASGGKYKLKVRPGSYRVFVSYVGSGNYTSLWAATGNNGGRIPAEGSLVAVTYGQTATAPAVTLARGATVTGVISDNSGTPIAKAGIVDVALRNANTDTREVIAQVRNGADGTYSISGVPDGSWWLRFVYNLGDGFDARAIKVNVSGGDVVSYQYSDSTTVVSASTVPAKLVTVPFRSKYGVSVTGTKASGHKLTAHAKAWKAGIYPTTYAKMSYQWRRNGVAISGATKSTYTLTKSDKGKSISVKVYATKYGYTSGSVTSRSYRIS